MAAAGFALGSGCMCACVCAILCLWVRRRAGGISPGSMPPLSKSLQEEGATIVACKLVDAGVFQVGAQCAASAVVPVRLFAGVSNCARVVLLDSPPPCIRRRRSPACCKPPGIWVSLAAWAPVTSGTTCRTCGHRWRPTSGASCW